MRFTVIGTDHEGRRFARETYAACPREAEIYVCLHAFSLSQKINVAAVQDHSNQRLETLDLSSPRILAFPEMLEELEWHLISGQLTTRTSRHIRWLHHMNTKELADDRFFTRAERLVRLITTPDQESEEIREALMWLSSAGLALLSSGLIPKTVEAFDLMYQTRATATIYGPVLRFGVTAKRLRLVVGG